MKALFFANIFAPIHGGSAVVYENICRYSPKDSICVLAPWRHYQTGEILHGWAEHDAKAPYKIYRMELLRPPAIHSKNSLHSLWLLLTTDIHISLKVIWQTIKIIRREKITVICIGELNSGSWLGLFLQTWFGIKIINYIHGEEVTTDIPYRFYGKRRRKYLKRADAIIAVSEFTKHALMELMHVPDKKITLITNGVDLNQFYPGEKDDRLINRYQLNNKRILLTVGRLIERKGIDMTIKALPSILHSCPDVHYLLAGEGPYRPELEKIIHDLSLEEHVTFAGRVKEEELVKHYQLCDLFLMPNRELSDHDTEGFGLVFLEANACNKAVIGGRAGGAVEAVRDGENGILVDGWNPDEIANATIKLLANNELRNQIEEKGFKIAQESSSQHGSIKFYDLCKKLTCEKTI